MVRVRRTRLKRWGILAIAVAGVIAWVAMHGDNGGTSRAEPAAAAFKARVVTPSEFEEIALSSGHPVYWNGPGIGEELLASKSRDGDVRVRYVEHGIEPRTDRRKMKMIGSYPVADAAETIHRYASRRESFVRYSDDDRLIVTSVKAPSNVFFASRDNRVLVEIYDPSPQRAVGLALGGWVQPVRRFFEDIP